MTAQNRQQHFFFGLFGLAMGATLAGAGFTNFTLVHEMFTFQNFGLLLVFAGAVVLNAIGFTVLARGQKIPKKPFTKGVVPGSAMFGVGWALTGACPAVALVQLGQGQLAAIATLSGILFGVWAYRRLAAGGLKLDTHVCGEES